MYSYRLVSLTCLPCNLLEHSVGSNSMAHLGEHKLVSNRQNAFRKRHSCEAQLTMVIHNYYWAELLDNKGLVNTFILDFEKSFYNPS